jgi:hypothetical protein
MAPRNSLGKKQHAIAQRGSKEAPPFVSFDSAMLTEEDYFKLRRCNDILLKAAVLNKAKDDPFNPFPQLTDLTEYAFLMNNLVFGYRCARIMEEEHKNFTLREIVGPISEVITKLEQRENIPNILGAFGVPRTAEWRPDDESLQPAIAQYETLLSALRKIRDLVPAPPKKRRGKRRSDDLYIVVNRLADIWERFTGEQFKQRWFKGEPISLATQFVHAFFEVADPNRLQKLPSITARTVTHRLANSRERRQSGSRKRATSHL